MLFSLQPLAFYEPSVYFSIFKQTLKFYSIFFKKLQGRGAVRQRKFGFQTKLPGRKRPSSGVFSDLRSEARHPPRRPLSLPCGIGVSAPSPQAPPRQTRSAFLPDPCLKVSSTFSKVAGSRGSAPDALRRARNAFSCEAHFSGELPRSGKRGLFASEKAPLHIRTRIHNHLISSERVFCRPAALKNLAIHKEYRLRFFASQGSKIPRPSGIP